jgi:hypothetical protein
MAPRTNGSRDATTRAPGDKVDGQNKETAMRSRQDKSVVQTSSQSAGNDPQSDGPRTAYDNIKFISARALAQRWNCSRTQVYRIAEREKLSKYCFGNGKNSMVRFLREEVQEFEKSRQA